MDGQENAGLHGERGIVDRRESILRRLDRSGIPLLLVRLILAATFIYMGAMKVREPFDFLKQVRMYHMLPESPPIYLNATAIVLPWLEIIAGLALIGGFAVRGAAAMLGIMLCVFTPAILLRALSVQAERGISFFQVVFDCGCGTGPVVIWTKLLVNIGLLALSVIALVSQSRRFCPMAWLEARPPDPSS